MHFDIAGLLRLRVSFILFFSLFFVSFVAQAHFKADFAYVEFSLLAI